ncbi:MAG: hypothetical protein JWL76_750 [Thermoleophilia bacterium]|nr:hypothetical protein [Thermoleophilia bacterium]
MHRLTTRAAIMLLIATFATGCDASRGDLAQSFMHQGSNGASSAAVAGAAGTPGTPGESVSSTTHAGSGELPAAWPREIAMPPGSHVGATTSIVSGDATLLSVSGKVGLPAHVVRAHFEEQFGGWEPEGSQWQSGVSTWVRGAARARVVVGETAGESGFMVRID